MKDFIRDYATAAFRYYARCGMPRYEDMYRAAYNIALEDERREIVRVKGVGNPTQQAIINAEAEMDRRAGEFRDILAVEQALAAMRPEVRLAVKFIYFAGADRELVKGDIERRVHRAEIEIPASRRQIYRWLYGARVLFSEIRGLRIPGQGQWS